MRVGSSMPAVSILAEMFLPVQAATRRQIQKKKCSLASDLSIARMVCASSWRSALSA